MFIDITAEGVHSLEDIDNFKKLEVVVSQESGASRQALDKIGRVEGDHLWLDTDWLLARGRPDDKGWVEHFKIMLAYARKSGWIDESGAVRVHIKFC